MSGNQRLPGSGLILCFNLYRSHNSTRRNTTYLSNATGWNMTRRNNTHKDGLYWNGTRDGHGPVMGNHSGRGPSRGTGVRRMLLGDWTG